MTTRSKRSAKSTGIEALIGQDGDLLKRFGDPSVGLPHLTDDERRDLMAHFLGCLTWRMVCDATGLDYGSLPRAGQFMSRKGIEPCALTVHPNGIPHGPHPGAYEGSIGTERTDELAVMIDTFRPLRLTTQAVSIEDDAYPYSWLHDAATSRERETL